MHGMHWGVMDIREVTLFTPLDAILDQIFALEQMRFGQESCPLESVHIGPRMASNGKRTYFIVFGLESRPLESVHIGPRMAYNEKHTIYLRFGPESRPLESVHIGPRMAYNEKRTTYLGFG